MRLQIEVKGESLVAEIAFVGFLARVDQHMSLELGIIQEALTTPIMCALEQLVAMDSVVLLQACPVVEDFATGVKRTPKHLWLLLGASTIWSATCHSSSSLLKKATSCWLRTRIHRCRFVLAIYRLFQTVCLLWARL
mgnify:CR=1 FL=1